MMEQVYTYQAVVSAYGSVQSPTHRTIYYSHEPAATAGHKGADLDDMVSAVEQQIINSPTSPSDHIAQQVAVILQQRWGSAERLVAFANSQLSPGLAAKASEADSRRRAERLDICRAICRLVFPGAVTPVPDMAMVVARYSSATTLLQRLSPISYQMDELRRRSGIGIESREQMKQQLAQAGLTEGVIARIALSELSPLWVASPRLSSAQSVRTHARLLQQARYVASDLCML